MAHFNVTLFAVFADGALIAEQENRPEFEPDIPIPGLMSSRFSWSVVSQEGFSGRPSFWLTHPRPDNSRSVTLNWSGISAQDWERGTEGQLLLAAKEVFSGQSHEVSVTVAIRSIDRKDLTFFTPDTVHQLTPCKPNAFDELDGGIYHFHLIPRDDIQPLKRCQYTSTCEVQIDENIFGAARDATLALQISHGSRFTSHNHAVLRLLVNVRPLKNAESGLLFNGTGREELRFVQGRPLELEIDGEPAGSAGFSWTIEDFDPSVFKLEPSFRKMERGSTAQLVLENLSDWDWIYGTGTHSVGHGTLIGATLVVQDGIRKPVRLPFTFGLKPVVKRFNLNGGTLLNNPEGASFEIAEDAEYSPVIDRSDPDHPVIRLENVGIRSVDGGAMSNLPAGAQLSFDEKLPLLGPATVGVNGLNMGDDDETEQELRQRVHLLWANPPFHSNRAQLVKIAEQVAGVDRAFIYPPFALDGMDGLGLVGCALVAPGRRPGVGSKSALALEVLAQLKSHGSFTASYVMMDVDEVGDINKTTGKGRCEVDLDLQISPADDFRWSWPTEVNPVVEKWYPERRLLYLYGETDGDRLTQLHQALKALIPGDTLSIAGQSVTVIDVVPESRAIYLGAPLLGEDNSELKQVEVEGQRVYSPCPLQAEIDAAIDRVFKELGTSETTPPTAEIPWQRRFPQTTFQNPDELRVARIIDELMDIDGIADARVIAPQENITPPANRTDRLASGGRRYKTFILKRRRLAVGPLLSTPGIDVPLVPGIKSTGVF